MESVKNIKQMFVAADCGRTTDVQIWDTSLPGTYLGNGEVVITAPNGAVLTNEASAATTDRIFIQQRGSVGGAKDAVYRSVEIPGNMITGFHCEQYAPSTEQSSILGFNGGSNAADIDLIAAHTYMIKVIPLFTRGDRSPETFSYRSATLTAPTTADVLVGLAGSINSKTSYDKNLKITASVLTNSTATSLTIAAAISNGSKYLTFAADVTTVSDGDVIKLGTASYIVDEVISARKLKLNMPYQGASETAIVPTLVTTKSAGDWGLQIDGLEYEFVPGFYNYKIAKFNLTVSEGINSKFITTAGDRGAGTYKQVADMEWHTKNFFGNNRKTHPQIPVTYNYDANLADTYDLITITWENTETKNIDGNTIQSGSIVLALPVPGAGQTNQGGAGTTTAGTTLLEAVLNNYIVTEFGVGTAIALTTPAA